MAKGTDDISGDYNQYSMIKDCESDTGIITLKRSSDGYNLSGQFSFAISSEKALTENEMIQIISSVE